MRTASRRSIGVVLSGFEQICWREFGGKRLRAKQIALRLAMTRPVHSHYTLRVTALNVGWSAQSVKVFDTVRRPIPRAVHILLYLCCSLYFAPCTDRKARRPLDPRCSRRVAVDRMRSVVVLRVHSELQIANLILQSLNGLILHLQRLSDRGVGLFQVTDPLVPHRQLLLERANSFTELLDLFPSPMGFPLPIFAMVTVQRTRVRNTLHRGHEAILNIHTHASLRGLRPH